MSELEKYPELLAAIQYMCKKDDFYIFITEILIALHEPKNNELLNELCIVQSVALYKYIRRPIER